MIFDTHAHYDDQAFDEDRATVLASLAEPGVGAVVDVAASVRSLARVKQLAEAYKFVYGAVGLHPDEVGGLTEDVVETIRTSLKAPKIVAVGEIGLDYHWDVEPHEVQIACFKKQIELAFEAGKPILVHSRAAAEDTMTVIQEMYGAGSPGADVERKGIIHAYAYSVEQARIYTNLGFCLGIGGVVTFKNSKKLRKVVAEMPLEKLVLETDCPYLTPEPHRGERNFSGYLRHVVEQIAEIKGIAPEEVERVTWETATRLFHV